MTNVVMYIFCVLTWGSTWLAITFQLSQVPPLLSVSYRFFLASFILFSFAVLLKRRLVFPAKDHVRILIYGLALFGLSYVSTYYATKYLTSGSVSVVYSLLQVYTIFNVWLFMKQKIERRSFIGGILGLIGILLVFHREVATFSLTDSVIGLFIALFGAYCASVAHLVALPLTKKGMPVTQLNAYAMLYGAIATMLFHLATGGELVIDLSFGYLWPLFYLAVMGSVIAFGCYTSLVRNIGADYTAYINVLSPILAMTLSTIFEGYTWTVFSLLGVIVVLFGSVVLLTPEHKLLRWIGIKRNNPQST